MAQQMAQQFQQQMGQQMGYGYQAQLPPPPQPLGIFNEFIFSQPVTLVLKEKMFDSFDINDINGHPVLRVKGHLASLHGRKSVYNLRDQHLFDISKELMHIHATFVVEDPGQRKLMEVKSSFALLGSKATATFTTVQGQPVSLMMKGNWFDTAADIVNEATGQPVARIQRQLTGGEILFGRQTYHLTVAPGVDTALLAAMCICMDEKNNEGKGGLCTVM